MSVRPLVKRNTKGTRSSRKSGARIETRRGLALAESRSITAGAAHRTTFQPLRALRGHLSLAGSRHRRAARAVPLVVHRRGRHRFLALFRPPTFPTLQNTGKGTAAERRTRVAGRRAAGRPPGGRYRPLPANCYGPTYGSRAPNTTSPPAPPTPRPALTAVAERAAISHRHRKISYFKTTIYDEPPQSDLIVLSLNIVAASKPVQERRREAARRWARDGPRPSPAPLIYIISWDRHSFRRRIAPPYNVGSVLIGYIEDFCTCLLESTTALGFIILNKL
ncbi:hypothetical protein EVAR_100720_1 [Eumeta japonica]|uniref:Uncharacterized protein n=1 Tax=Eumeta variegata TaxID=151549 RepID=A0A4C1ZX26_EUMVA|nr:hypothetical protein EVAR_100720_1 [Eumeta japonica]